MLRFRIRTLFIVILFMSTLFYFINVYNKYNQNKKIYIKYLDYYNSMYDHTTTILAIAEPETPNEKLTYRNKFDVPKLKEREAFYKSMIAKYQDAIKNPMIEVAPDPPDPDDL